jgi:hypothetical protein
MGPTLSGFSYGFSRRQIPHPIPKVGDKGLWGTGTPRDEGPGVGCWYAGRISVGTVKLAGNLIIHMYFRCLATPTLLEVAVVGSEARGLGLELRSV